MGSQPPSGAREVTNSNTTDAASAPVAQSLPPEPAHHAAETSHLQAALHHDLRNRFSFWKLPDILIPTLGPISADVESPCS